MSAALLVTTGKTSWVIQTTSPNQTAATPRACSTQRPWTQLAQVERPVQAEPEYDDDDLEVIERDGEDPFEDDYDDQEVADVPRVRANGRRRADAEVQLVVDIKNRLQRLYPGLRQNSMTQALEYGPVGKPIPVDDVSTSYVRISAGAGQVYPKTLVYDVALIVGGSTPITQSRLTSRMCSRGKALPLLRHPGH